LLNAEATAAAELNVSSDLSIFASATESLLMLDLPLRFRHRFGILNKEGNSCSLGYEILHGSRLDPKLAATPPGELAA
jgi:hypothetical protein